MKNKIKRNILFFLLLTLIFVSFNSITNAQYGELDSNFGVNGIIINTGIGRANCTVLQSDGKILTAGITNVSPQNNRSIIVVRYLSNGSIDSSFGTNGVVVTDLVPGYQIHYSEANVLLLQSDGKILIIGNGYRENGEYGNYDVLLIRYNSNGSLDNTFGNNGVVVSDFYDDTEYADAAAIQPDGKIVITGESSSTLLLARYNSNGSLDLNFGLVGYGFTKKLSVGPAYSLALQNDGKIVAGGINTSGNGERFMISRFQANGKSDSSFGTNGTIYTDFGAGGDLLYNIAIQSDGKILGTGKAGGAPQQEGSIAVVRYLSNGNIDTSFGIAGKVLTEIPAQYSTGKKILLVDNKIFVAAEGADFILTSYNLDGSLNTNFGEGGIQLTDMGGDENASDALLQPDGKIVVVGSQLSLGDYNSFVLARYRDVTPLMISFKSNERITEGTMGFTNAGFKIILNRLAETDITVHLETIDGSAMAGSDYKAMTGTIVVKAGKISKNVEVKVYGDTVKEANEKFFVTLSNPVNALLGENNTATCTIKNDDALLNLIGASSNDKATGYNNTQPKVYPNPATDNLRLSGLQTERKTTLFITDIMGNVNSNTTVTGSNYNLNISQLKAGNYFLKIVNGNDVITKIFVKQ